MINHIKNFFKLEAASGILLFAFAVLALVLANSGLKDTYFSFLNMPISIRLGDFSIDKPLLLWVNDGFMAVFFTLVGMEVKRELGYCGVTRTTRTDVTEDFFIGTGNY